MSSEPVNVLSDAPPPPRKKSGWLIIGIVAGVLIICTLAVCIGFVVGAPALGEASSATLCQFNYPDLTAEECAAWSHDTWTNHQQEFLNCQNSERTSTTTQGRNAELFACLEEKGIGPKN